MTEPEKPDWLARLEELAESNRAAIKEYVDIRVEVGDDPAVDDDHVSVEVCRRLGIPLPPPTIDVLTDACTVCGVVVAVEYGAAHIDWHERVMAAMKSSEYVAQLSLRHVELMGAILAVMSGVEPEDDSE